MAEPGRTAQVVALGVTQTIAWASSTYLPAVLAVPVAASLGFSPTLVFAAFSCSLIINGLLSPAIGRFIDRRGGRGVLCLSNGVLALGLVLHGLASGPWSLFLAWSVLGAGMALGLYDAAFAALVRSHGLAARGPITGVTLFGGFASTIGWPATAWMAAHWDWRIACFAWAAVHVAVALPLNALFLPRAAAGPSPGVPRQEAAAAIPAEAGQRRDFFLVAVFAAATAFVTSAMAAHLPGLLALTGAGAGVAIAAAALVGPAQVLARLAEFLAARRFRTPPLWVARVATSLHPLAGFLLLALGGHPVILGGFALLHGAGNGLITIAKGTLPLALFGVAGYGARQGLLAVAQRIMQAAAPFLFGLLLEAGGLRAALAVSVGMSLLALGALFLLQGERAGDPG